MLRPAATLVVLLTALAVTGCDSKDKEQRADVKAKAKGGKADGKAKAADEVPAGKVFFVTPKDGATVPKRVDVEMGVEGKTVVPAGATERDPLKGHHHIIIDGSPIADMQIVPKDNKHLHYGDGSTKTTLLLEPGKHTLTMQFADGAHRSYGEDWSATITVNVEEGPGGDARADDAKADDAKADDAKADDAKADDAKADDAKAG